MYTLDDYFRSQQVPLQWSPVLLAMAQELSAHADEDSLHQLFVRIGARFAKSVESQFEGISTLAELTHALNDLWNRTQWGWVALKEARDGIEIEHKYAPLSEAFGAQTLTWTVGLLEGFYQTVFHLFGASEKMLVSYLGQQEDGFCIHLKLACASSN
jgi:hypothetical protein